MTAYWVNTFTSIDDPDALARYAELATPAITAGGGRFVARGTPTATLEGPPALRIAVIEFPDAEAAVATYHSPAYQAALAALGDTATREIRIVPGVEPG